MKIIVSLLFFVTSLAAHDLATNDREAHGHYDFSVKPPGADGAPVWFMAQVETGARNRAQVGERMVRTNKPVQAAAFEKFAPGVNVRWDERFLFVESNGLPAHNMMVGITAWQQQVPLPQSYTGANAWQIPISPVPAKDVISIKNRFLRGAIALAANGIPIFNPQNNRGEVSQEIGELDQWGGHCGRADDYHYHAAPLHLQSVLGKALPIAYALDGYPIYGLTEPDGATPTGLDAFNGHETRALGYHYHASTKYPYVNGGFHGEVIEREEQVDPQPHAQPVRQALQALRGAKITGFEKTGANTNKLSYDVNGDKRAVLYAMNSDGSVAFEFQNGREGTTKETYTRRERGAGQGGPRPEGERRADDRRGPPRGEGGQPPRDGRGGPQRREGGGGQRGGESASTIGMDAMKKPSAGFVLTSPAVGADSRLPIEFTGDGSGTTLPLEWRGAPAGTKSFAVVMDHLAPGDTVKSYWVMWDIPAATTSLPKGVSGVGKLGRSFRGEVGYEPPHSQGPGDKTYVLTVYALSAPPQIAQQPREVTRDVLLTAIKDSVLASASMNVVYAREGAAPAQASPTDRRPDALSVSAPGGDQPPRGERRPPGGGGGKPDNKGLIKPTMADTVHVDVYADNWFAMFINGELVAVDSIKFTPHNVQSFDILPEYPMTIAIIAKDNADWNTGMEYGDHIGDGGFIVKFSDGTTSSAQWKAKNFFKGPLNHEAANPKVEHTPIPEGWWKKDFDDSAWANATEYTEQRVNPKEPFYKVDFSGAKWIWSDDLDLDNTVIFRTKIEKPGWTKRWNTTPDIDISGAPFK
jgi:phosphatidylethanolamine-binding protein (PEBP) family uncharacterized protein